MNVWGTTVTVWSDWASKISCPAPLLPIPLANYGLSLRATSSSSPRIVPVAQPSILIMVYRVVLLLWGLPIPWLSQLISNLLLGLLTPARLFHCPFPRFVHYTEPLDAEHVARLQPQLRMVAHIQACLPVRVQPSPKRRLNLPLQIKVNPRSFLTILLTQL
ncbi:hypothetical protein SLA2020_431130 [Shorea laevis]